MYKVIDLGKEFPETGETRVSLLDSNLIKTASNEIQDYWDNITDTKNYAYLWVLGVSAGEYYGCNNNGDYFEEDVLRKYKDTFLTNAHVFLHHINKDPRKSLGKPVFVYYNEDMHRVELILKLEKFNAMAQDTLKKLKKGEQIYVSMGCNVPYDKCSLCGQEARNRKEYCSHLKYNMKKILPNGKQIYAFNPTPTFFDISLVAKPADPTCFALDKVASQTNEGEPFMLSAEMGEISEDRTMKLAALDKLSDILKKVEGKVIEGKDDGFPFTVDNLPEEMDFPVMDFNDLEESGISPGGVIRISVHQGIPPSFGEIAYSCGKHHYGDDLTRDDLGSILSLIPAVMSILRMNPDKIIPLSKEVFDDYEEGELDTGHVKKKYGPVIEERKNILEKTGAIMPHQDKPKYMHPTSSARDAAMGLSGMHLSPYGPAFHDTYSFEDDHGNVYETDRRSVMQAKGATGVPEGIRKLLGGVLSAASIGALFTEPRLAKKLISSGILGTGAYSLLRGGEGENDYITTQEGTEIPHNTMFHTKKASTGAAVGMAAPAALGLDYLYNKKIKYPNHPYPEMEMGRASRATHRAGEFVKDNPFTSLAAGGIAGGASAEGLRRLLLRR